MPFDKTNTDGEKSRMLRKPRKNSTFFCAEKVVEIDYKDVAKLRRYISERGKIVPRRVTGTCARHQRQIQTAVKRARQIALLPFVGDNLKENMGGK